MGYLSDLTINITALRITTGEKLNKLYADIGDKSQLNTTNKTSLVNAINELNTNSAGYVKKTGDAMSGPLNLSGVNSGIISDGSVRPIILRNMPSSTGGWARLTSQINLGGNVIDSMGHYGSPTSLSYGWIGGGVNYNDKHSIRWTADGKVGIGLHGSIIPNEALDIVGTIKTSSHGTSENWKQAYDRGDFRDYGLGRYKTPAIPFSGLANETGFYFVNDTNELIPGTTHKQAKVLRLGNSSFSALASTLILSHNGNELGYRYADTEPTVRLWTSANLRSNEENDSRYDSKYIAVGQGSPTGGTTFPDADRLVNGSAWVSGDNRPKDRNSAIVSFTPFSGGSYGFQLGARFSDLFIRSKEAGTYQEWREVWTTKNFSKDNYYTKNESLGLFVGLNNTQSIGGTKTFSSSPIIPTATLNSHAINKGQMESWVTAQIAEGADSIWEHTPQGGLRIRNYNALATRDGAIAITKGGGATKTNAIGIGTSVNSDGNDGVVAGPLSANLGSYGTVVGPYSVNTPMEGVVIGPYLHNNQRGCTVTGRYNDPILNATTNTITDNSPLFLIGNGKAPSIRSNAYVMKSNGRGDFSNIQSYKAQHEFNDMDIPNVKWIKDNISGGGSGSEDWVSDYGSGISLFNETKANNELSDSNYGDGSGEMLSDQNIIANESTLVYLGNDGKWRKWTDTSNPEHANIGNTAVLGILLGDLKTILLKGYYSGKISPELLSLVEGKNSGKIFHSFNKGSVTSVSNTSNVERVFGYSINTTIGYFNPWMFK